MKTIVIFGQYKTGTTIIFQTIRESLPEQFVHELFESSQYKESSNPRGDTVLAKIILGVDSEVRYEDFLTFEHAIYIVRDPRDWLISGMLFVCQQEKNIWSDKGHTKAILNLLEQKERDAGSISVYALLGEIATYLGKSIDEMLEWMKQQQHWLAKFELRRQFHTLRYEQFVAGDHGELESYLEIRLTCEPVILPKGRSHSARTRSSGNWKSWFVESDVEIFNPIFEDYMIRHDYGRSWVLDTHPKVSAEHCSKYVAASINRRRKLAGVL